MRTSGRIILFVLAVLSAAYAQSEERPNFLIIMTDDMGFTDLGAFGGHDIRTPNLDELALNGIRFTNFHGHIRCAPSRALLMSGTGNHEAGLGTQVGFKSAFGGQRGYERYLTDRVVTLPEILRERGYHTYIAGKWDLGGPQRVEPAERGFEKSMVGVEGAGGHYQAINPKFRSSGNARYRRNGEAIAEQDEPTYSTTLYTDALISFFEEDKASDKAFFALYAPTAPHWPLHYPPAMRDTYAGAYSDGYEVLREQRIKAATAAGVLPEGADLDGYESKATAWQLLSDEDKAINSRLMEIYAAMTTHLDAEVGRLLDKLRDIGALDNTLVMFINDNGALGGPIFRVPANISADKNVDNSLENLGAGNSWARMGQGWAEAANAPFRGGKGSVYEGGVRVAAFVYWGDANHTESINRQYLNNMDVMPTLLELAGMTHPAPRFDNRDVLPMRGKSFAGILRGNNSSVHEPSEVIALSSTGLHFMFRGNLKLLKEVGSDWELYDLAADPYERHNLSGTQPELLQELLAEFEIQAAKSNILDR